MAVAFIFDSESESIVDHDGIEASEDLCFAFLLSFGLILYLRLFNFSSLVVDRNVGKCMITTIMNIWCLTP